MLRDDSARPYGGLALPSFPVSAASSIMLVQKCPFRFLKKKSVCLAANGEVEKRARSRRLSMSCNAGTRAVLS